MNLIIVLVCQPAAASEILLEQTKKANNMKVLSSYNPSKTPLKVDKGVLRCRKNWAYPPTTSAWVLLTTIILDDYAYVADHFSLIIFDNVNSVNR